MNRFWFLYLFFAPYLVNAYHPTPESLYRNASNPTITQNTLVANFMIEPVAQVAAQGLQGFQGAQELGELSEMQAPKLYLKLLYSIDGERPTNLLQLLYKDKPMKERNLLELKTLNSYPALVKRTSIENVETAAFYSLLNSLLLNDGTLMIEFLNGQGVALPYNQQLKNQEKLSLLLRIQKYFQKIKYNPSLESKIESPLAPKDREQRRQVQLLLTQNFFDKDSSIERVKRGNDFFWSLQLPRFQSFHTNEGRKLVSWSLETKGGKIEYYGQDFMLFDGIHEFPKTIYIKDLTNQFYKVRMISMNFFNDTPRRYNERYEEYRLAAAKNQNLIKTIKRPSILF